MRKGFTLIEILVFVAISAMLSTIAILYSRTGQNQVALYVEASKISQFILQAKELSISTYGNAGVSCGYGVAIDISRQAYSIFSYAPSGAPPCPAAASVSSIAPADTAQYTPGTWNVKPAQNIILKDGGNNDSIAYVLFYPPAPATILIDNGAGLAHKTSYVYLSTSDGAASTIISVNTSGQVSL
jgi:prepilin-type N-terminal cleavage/methylation domain-containing protein